MRKKRVRFIRLREQQQNHAPGDSVVMMPSPRITDTDIAVFVDLSAFADGLPRLQRNVLISMFVDGLTVGEVKDTLHVSHQTISAARDAVSQKLGDYVRSVV